MESIGLKSVHVLYCIVFEVIDVQMFGKKDESEAS